MTNLHGKAGFISPLGDIIECRHREHFKTGIVISQNKYNSGAGVLCLEQEGWIRVFCTGIFEVGGYDGKNKITDDQVDTVLELIKKANEGEYKDNLKYWLQYHVEEREYHEK